jgi:4-amino-4-deoxy-L-arabinose transferase-like glycosyltransferase
VLIGLLYSAAVHSLPMNSDGATVVLEGKAMSGGNLLLNHWGLSLDSFWLVDVPLYAIAVLIAGVHPQLMHLVPAVIAAGVVVTGVWIAWRSLSKWSALFAAGTVVVILGLPTHAFTEFYLLGPLHVATTLWCLFAFIALRRARFGWGWVLALCLLSAGLVGDFQTLVLGVLPIGLAGLIAMVRTRQWRRRWEALCWPRSCE